MTGIVRRITELEKKAGLEKVKPLTIKVCFVDIDGKVGSTLLISTDGKREWRLAK